MQTKVQAPADQSSQHQGIQAPLQCSADSQLGFADCRDHTAQLKLAQASMAASPHQQSLHALQAKMNTAASPAQLNAQQKPNNTGLPDNLKAGIENLSGISMDHVKVHYNSEKPAQLSAHAYAQGSEIHVAPGQEKHLPHEAWHVVQQAQGRVKPSAQLENNTSVNQLNSGGAIQRKTFLANEDQNIYEDDVAKIELAYLGDMGDAPKLPLFMHYNRYQNLADVLLNQFKTAIKEQHPSINKLVREGKRGPDSSGWWNELSKYSRGVMEYIMQSEQERSQFLKDVGDVFYEDAKGVLQQLDVSSWLVLLQARLTNALANGPLYRNVGGGSRNPPAEGVFFTDNKSITLLGVLESIGVKPDDIDKYSKVELRYIDDYHLGKQHIINSGGHIWEDETARLLYISSASLVRSKSARFMAAGQYYSENFGELNVDAQDKKRVDDSFNSFGVPQNQGWQEGTKLGKTDRGDGQAKAMKNWNALGVAAYSNVVRGTGYSLGQNWEWLHIQGAQIGGVTDATNLVAGTFSTNSEMIPIENLIAKCANKSAKTMCVRFSSDVSDGVLSPDIGIEIAAENHPELGTISQADPLSIKFNAHSAAVADKLTSKLQQKKLEIQAESRQPPVVVEDDYDYDEHNNMGADDAIIDYESQ